MDSDNLSTGIEAQCRLTRNNGLWLPYVFLVEQELPIQVRQINSIEIDLRGQSQSNNVKKV